MIPGATDAPLRTGDLSKDSQAALDETVAATALRLERAISLARIVFFGAILVRFFWIAVLPLEGLLLTAVPFVLGILFSLAVLVLVRVPPRRDLLWLASVTVDSLAVLGALLPDALWPTAEYMGISFSPATSGILIATFAAGLRLSPRAAALGGLLNTATLLALVCVDRVVLEARFATGLQTVSLPVILVAASGALASIFAVTTRRLVQRGALVALRADRAEQGLGVVLADHHDLGSLLSSALVGVDLLAREIDRVGAPAVMTELSRDLASDLRQVHAVVTEVKARALGDLSARGERSAVDLAEVAERVSRQAKTRFEGIDIDDSMVPGDTRVLFAGGAPSLHRALLNLVVNACEGDGQRGPSRVTLSARPDQALGVVDVVVEDDGGGLPASVLEQTGGECEKPGGLGVGLALVRGLTEASGGCVRLENGESGGGRVTLTLLQPPSPAP